MAAANFTFIQIKKEKHCVGGMNTLGSGGLDKKQQTKNIHAGGEEMFV